MGNFGGIVAGSQLRTMAQVIQLILLPKGETNIDEQGGASTQISCDFDLVGTEASFEGHD